MLRLGLRVAHRSRLYAVLQERCIMCRMRMRLWRRRKEETMVEGSEEEDESADESEGQESGSEGAESSEDEGDELSPANVERVLDVREHPQEGEQFHVKFRGGLACCPLLKFM